MDGIELKKIWKSSKQSYGAWFCSIDPMVASVMCNVGFDWMIIDTEHHCYNLESLRNIVMILQSNGVVPIVRILDNDTALIKKVLDLGAEGIMVPMVQTVDEARRAVRAAHYPPKGVRGFQPIEAVGCANNGSEKMKQYLSIIEQRVIVMIQIETIEGVENFDEILKVSGIDAIMVGPADLSFSLGFPLQIEHSRVQDAINILLEKANASGIPISVPLGQSVKELKYWQNKGVNFQALNTDTGFIETAANDILDKLRRAEHEK